MKRIKAPTIPNNRATGMVYLVIFILCMICSRLPVEALEQTAGSAHQAQTSIIVYLHPVATDVEITVDDLLVFKTGSVFGVWCYQANLTSFLEAKPRTVHIKTRLKNRESSYCEIEVRKVTGDIDNTEVLAEKTIRVADMEALNKMSTEYFTALTIDISLPGNSFQPLWTEADGIDFNPVMRNTSNELVKEIFTAIQKCNFNPIMKLIDPALTNQAMMEGVPPELFKQAMRNKLMRYCVSEIPIAETMQNYYRLGYSDRMAPIDFDKMTYSFMKDPNREDKRGNVYSPDEPILFSTKSNDSFVVRIFLSYTNKKRDKRYVSRFLFDRVE